MTEDNSAKVLAQAFSNLGEAMIGEMKARQDDRSMNEALLENFTDEQIIRALKQLPGDQRLTLFLVDVERLSQQAVAEITGVAVGTVKSRTSRARSELRRRLTPYATDLGFDESKR